MVLLLSIEAKICQSITTKTNVVAGMGTRVDTKVKNITKTWEDADKALRLDFLNPLNPQVI